MKEKDKPLTRAEITKELPRSIVNVILSPLGLVGEAMNEGFFGLGDRVREKRFKEFVGVLAEKIEKIEVEQISKEYLESEEFYDFNIRIFNSVLRTRFREKYQMLGNLFAQELDPKSLWKSDLSEPFAQIIEEFTINHFIVFQFFIDRIDQFEKSDSYEDLHKQFVKTIGRHSIDLHQFRLYCRDISTSQLLRFSSNINEIGRTGGYIALETYSEVPGINLTSLGEEFVKLLSGVNIS